MVLYLARQLSKRNRGQSAQKPSGHVFWSYQINGLFGHIGIVEWERPYPIITTRRRPYFPPSMINVDDVVKTKAKKAAP